MKNKRIKETSIEVAVGGFMFMVLVVLAVFTIVLSRQNLFRRTYEIEVDFENVMGLRAGDHVHVRGVSVGQVKQLEVLPDRVRLTAALEQPLRMRENYRVEILTSSALGGRHLLITEGVPPSPLLPEDTVLRGIDPKDLIDEASQTIALIQEALDEGGVLEHVRSIMRNVDEVTGRLARGEGTLGRLLADDAIYDQLAAATADFREITGRLARGEGTLGRLLTEDEVYDDLRLATAHIKEISGRLAAGEGTLGRLLSEEETLYDDFSGAAANLREITSRLLAGEGALGKIMQEDALYDEVRHMLHEVRAAIDDFRETAPLTTFSSIFFGAL